jgi:hypothetical protein
MKAMTIRKRACTHRQAGNALEVFRALQAGAHSLEVTVTSS